MSSLYRRGLVVGKFCPLHRGHELLIEHALVSCEEVFVISYTKPGFEGYGREKREAWLASRFPEVKRLVVDDVSLSTYCRAHGIAEAPSVPFDNDPDATHRDFVSWLCTHVLRTQVDSVFTSEEYGDGFAAALSAHFGDPVTHVCVDRNRSVIPISGTRIRSDPLGHRNFLPPVVSASFVKRICIFGGESSGKTTLAQALAEKLDTVLVAEYGRELWEKKNGVLRFEDMVHIAEVQIEREEALAQQAGDYLICDTSPLTTLFYSDAIFQRISPRLQELANRSYDYVFLCAPDFEFVQDGTRRDDEFRQCQHRWYRDALASRNVEYVELKGGLADRLVTALRFVTPVTGQSQR